MPFSISRKEPRSKEELQSHYRIERDLANRLRSAGKPERRHLYSDLYNELYRLLPNHPQFLRKEELRQASLREVCLLRKFLNSDCVFLEIGPGDCSLSFEMAKYVKHVFAVDVSSEITQSANTPENFTLLLTDGCSVDLDDGSVDFAFSNQLMEHLHPDDAIEQIRNIYKVLKPGGQYFCITPNRLNGPHDISRYFDDVATGFHLKEYTVTELSHLFKQEGFAGLKLVIFLKGLYFSIPIVCVCWLEGFVKRLPKSLSRKLADIQILRLLLGIRLVAIK